LGDGLKGFFGEAAQLLTAARALRVEKSQFGTIPASEGGEGFQRGGRLAEKLKACQ
jgi:hypothetical protein